MSSFPLRALGIVSFGLYLVHMMVMDKLKEVGVAPGDGLFFLTLLIGYALACGLYGLIERPFIRMGGPVRGQSQERTHQEEPRNSLWSSAKSPSRGDGYHEGRTMGALAATIPTPELESTRENR